MSVCLGPGLREVTGSVEVATPADWGGTGLSTFGSDDQAGAPVYCDAAGQLRTVPPSTSATTNISSSSGVGAAFGGSTSATGPTVTAVIANPSAYRAASLLIVYAVKWQVVITTPGAALLASINAAGTVIGDIGKFLGYPGQYTTEEYVSESWAADIAAGGSHTFSITPRVDPGGGTGRLAAQGVGIRAMAVTQ